MGELWASSQKDQNLPNPNCTLDTWVKGQFFVGDVLAIETAAKRQEIPGIDTVIEHAKSTLAEELHILPYWVLQKDRHPPCCHITADTLPP